MNEKKYVGFFFCLMEDLIYVDVKFLLKYGLYLYEEKVFLNVFVYICLYLYLI